MNAGKDHVFGSPHSQYLCHLAVIGAGAAAPTIPVDGKFTPTTSTYPTRANRVSRVAAEIPTRAGVGLYTITIRDQLVNVLNLSGTVFKAGAAPTTGLVVDFTSVDPVARQIVVRIATQAGVLTDLGTNDMLVISLFAQDSSA